MYYRPEQMKPKEYSFHTEGWLSVVGIVLSMTVLVWFFFTPELFLLQVSLLLVALLMTAIGGAYVLKSPPSWLWIGLIVFAFCMMDFSVSRGGVQAGGFSVQSVLKGLVWIIVAMFGIYHGHKNLFLSFPLAAFFTYCLFATCSASYSPSMGLAIGSGIALIALSTYAGVIAGWSRERIQHLWRVLFISIFVMAVVSIILGFAFPNLAKDYIAGVGSGRLMGVTGSANSLGAILSMGSIAGLYCISSTRTRLRKVIYFVLLSTVLVALVWTDSRSSIIGLVSSYVLMAMFSSLPGLIVGLIGAALMLWFILQPQLTHDILSFFAGLVSRTGSVSDITTFNGRNDIWAAVFQKWLEHPWFGYGLASPRVVISQIRVSQWQLYEEAHNALLESLLSFGVFGASLLLLFIISLVVCLFKLRSHLKTMGTERKSDSTMVICLIRCVLFLIAYGLMEKAYAGMPSPATIMFALVVGSYAALARDGFTKGTVDVVANPATVFKVSPVRIAY